MTISQQSKRKLGLLALGSAMLVYLAGVAWLIGNATGDWLPAFVSAGLVGLFVPLIVYGRYVAGQDAGKAARMRTQIVHLLKWVWIALLLVATSAVLYFLARNN
jgi:hypothetical protein